MGHRRMPWAPLAWMEPLVRDACSTGKATGTRALSAPRLAIDDSEHVVELDPMGDPVTGQVVR